MPPLKKAQYVCFWWEISANAVCLYYNISCFVFIEMGSKKEQGMHFNIYITLPHIRNTTFYIFHLILF